MSMSNPLILAMLMSFLKFSCCFVVMRLFYLLVTTNWLGAGMSTQQGLGCKHSRYPLSDGLVGKYHTLLNDMVHFNVLLRCISISIRCRHQ